MRDRAEDFFVGYVAPPARLWRFVRTTSIVLLLALGIAAAVIAFGQRDPGDGVWSTDPAAITGTISEHPYPTVRTKQSDGSIRAALLVSEGKLGAAERTRGLDGRSVKITGTTLDRGPIHLVEIADGTESIKTIEVAPLSARPNVELSQVTLRGEILDPKCFSGAMKPGDGKAHKACATLCIRGGIPPVFVEARQPRAVYLLADETGRALTGASLEAVLPFVADRVELRGTISRGADGALPVLCISAGSIKRL